MIYEWRSYDLLPGKVPEYMELFQAHGLAIVTRHLPMMGYWATETGVLNRLHHLWAYADLADRALRREALGKELDWGDRFTARAMPLVIRQRNSMLELVYGGERLHPFASPNKAATASAKQQRAGTDLYQMAFFSAGRVQRGPNTIASWNVVSGYRVGSLVTLSSADPSGSLVPGEAEEHEVLRPFAFSPLH